MVGHVEGSIEGRRIETRNFVTCQPMLIRSKAPLRLGLAGGGTDVAPFSDIYGGAILNATINLYAHATLELLEGDTIFLEATDKQEKHSYRVDSELPIDGNLDLHKGIYNRIIRQFKKEPFAFRLTTFVDAPPGSGLGSSSTLVVAILGAFSDYFNLPLGEYDLAHLAYEIERVDLSMAGGKQDQYAATFGGVNFMEFFSGDKVIVNPLRIKQEYLHELAHNLILINTETSRLSSNIIENQVKNVLARNEKSIDAMQKLKEQAYLMKEALLKGELDRIGEILDFGWKHKKMMAEGISNSLIDELYASAIRSGSIGGKISGAGGGGFIFFYCPGNTRNPVIHALQPFGGTVKRYEFVNYGLTTWRSK